MDPHISRFEKIFVQPDRSFHFSIDKLEVILKRLSRARKLCKGRSGSSTDELLHAKKISKERGKSASLTFFLLPRLKIGINSI